MKNKFVLISVFLVFTILLLGSFTSAYSRSNPRYTSSYSYSSGFFGATDNFNSDMCKAGQDFVLQIDPLGCEPSVVRSDLLEDQNVFVFCPIVATQINPLIDIKAVKGIRLSGRDLPKDVADIGFHPADSALGYDNKIHSPVLNNLGYAVVELKKQPVESKMPDFVEGNISAKILYDIDNAFGVGRANFYLDSLKDNEWNKEFSKYSFWNGRGFLRAENVGTDQARISVYSGNSLAKNDKSYHEKIASFSLNKGEVSKEVYLPTFDSCMGGLKVSLDDVENTDTKVKLMINSNEVELLKGEKFLNDRCQVKDFSKIGINKEAEISCDEDGQGLFSSTDFTLRIIPRINLTVNGVSKEYSIGDRVYDGGGKGLSEDKKSIYLVYAYTKGNTQDKNDLVVALISSPLTKDHLSDEDLSHWKNFIERYRTDDGNFNTLKAMESIAKSPGSYGESVMNTFAEGNVLETLKLNEEKEIPVESIFDQSVNSAINSGQDILHALSLGLYTSTPEKGKAIDVKLLGLATPTDFNLKGTENSYNKAFADFDNLIDNFKELKEKDNLDSYGQRAFEEKIKLAKNSGKKKTMLDLCKEFSKEYPKVSTKSLGCLNYFELANVNSSSKTVLIDNELKEISLEGISEPKFEDYNAEIQIVSKDGNSKTITLGKDQRYYFESQVADSQDSIFSWPVKNPRVSSCFGCRKLPSKKGVDSGCPNDHPDFHDGIDIVNTTKNLDVLAAGDGTVDVGYNKGGWGNYIVITHSNGYKTLYGHLSKVLVKKGETVSRGQKIGEIGSGGYSTGSHLHFGVYAPGVKIGGNRGINPLCFLPDPGKGVKFTGTGCYSTDSTYAENLKHAEDLGQCSGVQLPQQTPSYDEYIQLDSLGDDSAKLIGNVNERGFFSSQFTDNIWDLNLGETREVGDYLVTLKKVNVKKVAKVSVIPKIDYTESEAQFNFKIGIEKRNFQSLAPDKIQKKIDKLNKSIDTWTKLSEGLASTVKVWKKACLGTEAALTAKNLVQNADGKGIARQEVMNANGGWYDKCKDFVSNKKEGDTGKVYTSVDQCLIEESDFIEADVDTFYNAIKEQNVNIKALESSSLAGDKKLLGQDNVDTNSFMDKYSKRVRGVLNKEIINSVDSSLNFDDINKSLSYSSWKDHHTYSVDDLKKIELYTNILEEHPDNVIAQNGLKSVLNNVKVNAGDYADQENYANDLGVLPSQTSFFKLDKDETELVWHGLKNGDLGAHKIGAFDDNVPIEVLMTSQGGKYVLVLDNSFGGKELPIKKDTSGKSYIYQGNERVTDYDSKLDKIYFKKYDKSSYKNKFKYSSGESEPVVRYFETEPYKGLPAVIPFDKENGWYVASKATLPVGANIASYDKSGRVNSFWLCNVGENGIEEFNNGMGDDICQMINLGTGGTYAQFYGLDSDEISELVSDSAKVIEDVSRQYPAKSGRVKVSSSRGNYILKVGSPAVEVPDIQCQDFMSPKDCNLIFNACDPVICPSSRCDFGGNYPVSNVIQSGIIGSIALCAPNYKEKIYAPVCLTGVQAGVDSWLSVKKSYRDCLKKNLETGERIGICDEINSVYTCDFFWRQALPLAKATLPNVLGLIAGEKARGGGEYMAFQNAWQNAGKSLEYFTKTYAQNAYAAFKARSSQEAIGGSVCKLYSSIVVPKPEALLDQLTEPDSPTQFSGRFDEIPYTTVTNPPISHYKVSYHIFAGKDQGAYYRVYLRQGPQSSFYQDTAQMHLVGSGYIPKGKYNTTTLDFTAPSGYKEMCIMVNGQEECDFKEVSTSFAVNYVQDEYTSEQSTKKDIHSESECISGSASLYNFLTPNIQSSAEGAINPAIYNRGIIRICATDNPGVGTDAGAEGQESRWVDVGYCGDEKIRCWLDRNSVDDSIKFANIKNKTLSEVQDNWNEALKKSGKCSDDFYGEMNDILNKTKLTNDLSPEEKISKLRDRISSISDLMKRACFMKEKAKAYFERGKAYAKIVSLKYQDYLDKLSESKANQNQPTSSTQPATSNPSANQNQQLGEVATGFNYPIIVYNTGFLSSNVDFFYNKNEEEWMVCSGTLLSLGTSQGSCNDLNSKGWVFVSKADSLGTAPSQDLFDISKHLVDKGYSKDYIKGLSYLMDISKTKGNKLDVEGNSLSIEMDSDWIFTLDKGGNSINLRYDETEKGWMWKASSSPDNIQGVGTWASVSTPVLESSACGYCNSFSCTPSLKKKLDKECENSKNVVRGFKDSLTSLKDRNFIQGADLIFKQVDLMTAEAQGIIKNSLSSDYEKKTLEGATGCGDCSNWVGLKCTFNLCAAIKVKTGLNCVPHVTKYLGRIVCEEEDKNSISSSNIPQKYLDAYKSYDSLFEKYSKMNLPQGWTEVQFRALLVAISTQETGLGTSGNKCGLKSNEPCSDWLMGYTKGASYPSSFKSSEKQIDLASTLLKKALSGASSSYHCGFVSPNDEAALKCVLQTYGPSSTEYPKKVLGFWKSWVKKFS